MKKKIMTIRPIYTGLGLIFLLLLIFGAVTLNHNALDDWTPPPDLTGHWSGKSEVFAAFKQGESQRPFAEDWIDIDLNIHPDSTVTGYAGLAELTGCLVKRNRNNFERMLGIKTDFIINGTLQNGITAGDEISFRDITIPFNLYDGQLKGSLFHNEAWKYPDPIFPRLILKKMGE